MKNVLFAFAMMLVASFNLSAAERVIHSYLYHGFEVYDRENNLIQEMPTSSGDPFGLFLVAEIDGEKYLTITVGETSLYEFRVALSKNVDEKDGTRADVYAGGMTVEEQIVPLQVFVCYSKSTIPDVIIVDVFNSPTLIELSRLVKAGH
ncbi:MAG: hypothetical protein K2H63_08430 [Paramuribaculum sp.]|nr:hypothetical protein [Paramuribaculum sp.]